MIKVDEVNKWLSLEKITTKPMKWVLSKTTNNRKKYESSIELVSNGKVIESMFLHCSYLPETEYFAETFSNTLLLNKQRIYAIDVADISKKHKNKVGKGKKLFSEIIYGSHEHTWSHEGYGYAEPLEEKIDCDPVNIWKVFEEKTKINIKDGFIHPLQKDDKEQYLLTGLSYD